jgi:hypothetical protein
VNGWRSRTSALTSAPTSNGCVPRWPGYGVGLAIFRSIYPSNIPASLPADGVAALFGTLVRFTRQVLRLLLLVGLIELIGRPVIQPGMAGHS